MNIHTGKTQKSNRQPVVNALSRERTGSDSPFQFVDNRPDAYVQRKLQEIDGTSPQVKQAAQLQMRNRKHSLQGNQPIQRKENIGEPSGNMEAGVGGILGYSQGRARPSEIVQLKPALAKVTWGVTHAVKEVNGSILGDGEYEKGEVGAWGELTLNEVLTVDDDDLFMSRRGSNQEIESRREESRSRRPEVEWVRALKIKGVDVGKLNVYVRSETIHIGEDVVDPEANWSKVTVKDVHWDDKDMLSDVKDIGTEYEKATGGRSHVKGRNICSTEDMNQDDEGLDVAREFVGKKSYRDLSGDGEGARTRIAEAQGKLLIGVMQITIEEESSERFLYIKWLLGRRSSRGAGVALVRSALEYAIQNSIMKIKVESAMSAVGWYKKRGFSKVGNAQHMNDKWEKPLEDEKGGTIHEEDIDCGCARMELQFYWDKKQ